MAGWGLMSGLGAGLTGLGNTVTENAKEQMREKMLTERERRAEQRQIDKENRDSQQFAARVPEKRDGVWYEVDYNKAGEEMDARLASQSTVQKQNAAEQKEKLDIENAILSGQKTKAEIEHLPQKYALESELRRAQIGNYEASAGASDARVL